MSEIQEKTSGGEAKMTKDDDNVEQSTTGERTREEQKEDGMTLADLSSVSETMEEDRKLDKADIKEERRDDTATAKRGELVGKTVGECKNILPVLVEHLRSALESNLNSSASLSRTIAPYHQHHFNSTHHQHQHQPQPQHLEINQTMDLNFFEDLLLSDIKTALIRLQDTLRRVDLDALSRYSSTLEPDDKLHLLQLISNLVSNLKKAKLDDLSSQSFTAGSTANDIAVITSNFSNSSTVPEVTNTSASGISLPVKRRQHPRGRDRHTIGVSNEELARARQWLEEKGASLDLSQSKVVDNFQLGDGEMKDKVFENSLACDKHIKDAINQQQSLQNRNKDADIEVNAICNDSLDSKINANGKLCENISNESISPIPTIVATTTATTTTIFNKSNNKFSAKKSKIKRANTIDIPNYLKLQAEKKSQSFSPGLRKPIDISDRFSWNLNYVNNFNVPSFEPKTDNDRKFLALINRDNDNSGSSPSNGLPFKSFNYRQTSSIADKNWKSRFSNIKTTFDKSPVGLNETCRNSQNHFPPKSSIFNHAATSPFKKIQSLQKKSQPQEVEKVPTNYLPACATNGMLKAKLKMFDQSPVCSPVDNRPKPTIKPEKIIKDINSNLSHYEQLLKMNKNSVNNHNNGYDKSRRNSMYDGKLVDKSQRRQSVAVQTNYFQPYHVYQPPPIPPMPKNYYQSDNPIYTPPQKAKEIDLLVGDPVLFDSQDGDISDSSFMDDENIENQDISDNKVVTRYTSAIVTVEKSPSPSSPTIPAQTFTPIVTPNYYPIERPPKSVSLRDDVQRHNILQQSLIRQMQDEFKVPKSNQRYSMIRPEYEDASPESSFNGRDSCEPLIESNNTQEKINLFEEKSTRKPDIQPHPKHSFLPPKINVTSPRANFSSPLKYSSPVDSSDEYLVSCANRPQRSIVLSKSESWHQLAKNQLQIPPAVSPSKPPRNHLKYLESSDTAKKVEKIQSYFPHQQTNRQIKNSKRSFSNSQTLTRSHTMPHIYDDLADVDKAFDTLFEETTRDNRH